MFGPFIEWFIRSVILQHQADPPKSSRDLLLCDEARAARDGQEDLPCLCSEDWPDTGGFSQWFSGGSPAEGEAMLWRLMLLIHMFEFILTCIENADGKPRLGREWWWWKRSARLFPGTTRTIRVVLFGVFQAEEVMMPDDIAEAVYQQLLAHSPHASDSAASISPLNLDIPLVLENLYLRSGIPNKGVAGEYNRHYNLPPPPLQIFTFTPTSESETPSSSSTQTPTTSLLTPPTSPLLCEPTTTPDAASNPDSSATADTSTDTSLTDTATLPSQTLSISTLPLSTVSSTTTLVVPMLLGHINVSTLSWSITWRRCSSPATRPTLKGV